MSPAPAESQPPKPPPRDDLLLSRSSDGIIVQFGETIIRFGRWVHGSVEIGSTETAASPKEESEGPTERHLKLYAAFRDYTKHEDNLTNNRLNWNFTIQGFLFFSWAYGLQKLVDLKIEVARLNLANSLPEKIKADTLQSLGSAIQGVQHAMTVLGFAGFSVSALILFGALAAQIAIRKIEHKWLTEHIEYRPNTPWHKWYDPNSQRKRNTHGPHLAGVVGGGSLTAHVLGFSAPLLIPLVFMAAWWILLDRS
jgi:hypothetical protein